MQGRTKRSGIQLTDRDFEAALGALSREQLCEFLRSYARSLDEAGRRAFDEALVLFDRGAGSGLFPISRRDPSLLGDIQDFIREAQGEGEGGDFFEFDELLERIANVFERGDYGSACAAYEALLGAVASAATASKDYDDLAAEIFTTMMSDASARYLVSLYETTSENERAQAIWAALEGPARVGHLHEPLSTLERYAQDPLPDFDGFVSQWVALLEDKVRQSRRAPAPAEREATPERLLREAVGRLRVA
ncbi:MAG TPA: hypothetical protein VFS43_43630 [Polyangiaceae bacterium]|nr:hypothetical protein [Polyangiaceae bacterium]